MKVDKGLIYLYIVLFIYCFNVLKWRCKADHAVSTHKLGMKKKREREKKKLSCATAKKRNQENTKVRELLSHIGPIPIVIPLKI